MSRRDVGLAVLVTIIWGANFTIIELGLAVFPPLLFAALRFALTAIPAVFFVKRPASRHWSYVVAVGLLLGVGQFGLLFLAQATGMPAGLASVVLQAQAFFTLALTLALTSERLSGQRAGVLVISCAGLVIVGLGVSASAVPMVAFVLILAAALCWAVANLATRLAGARSGFSLVVWSSLVPPLPLLGLSLAFEGVPSADELARQFSWQGIGTLAYVVILSTLVAYGVWNSLLNSYSPAQVAPFSLLVPVSGLLVAWWAMGEVPTPLMAGGAALIVIGLTLQNVRLPGRGLLTKNVDTALPVTPPASLTTTAAPSPSGSSR